MAPLDKSRLITRLTRYQEATYWSVRNFPYIRVSQDVGIEQETPKRMKVGPWAARKSRRGICTTRTLVATLVHM